MAHAVLEEARRLGLLRVELVDVDAQDEGAGGDLRGPVLEEGGLVQLELADLEGHLEDHLVLVVIQDSQEALQRLHRTLEIKVEAEAREDLLLHFDELWLGYILLLLFGKQSYHAGEAGRDGLLQLG